MGSSPPAGLGVIIVAERPLSDLLSTHDVGWTIQERQPSIAAMWDALSGGRLDQHSRVLVFSDSLMDGTSSEEAELVQTARAIVAMSHAGAHVFLAVWRPARLPRMQQLIAQAATGQGLSPGDLVYHFLPVEQGGRAVLDSMRRVLEEDVAFPEAYPATIDGALSREAFVPSTVWVTEPETTEPEVAEPEVTEPAPPNDSDAAGRVTFVVEPGPASEPRIDPPEPPPGIAAPPVAASPVAATARPIGLAARAPGSAGRPALPPIGVGAPAPAADSSYPAAASMELLNQPKRPGQVTITVTSSKGGSGKSTASILLGGSIARASRDAGTPLSVCLIDLDTRDGQVASLIGKFMPTALNIRVQPVWDEERIRRNLVHAEGLGVDTLLAPIRPRTADTVGPDFYRTMIRSLQRMYDVIVMDTSVQYLDPLIAEVALPEADEVLFVTTLASTAVQGMARALREITAPVDESGLGIPREKIGIIVNQSVANVGMERDQVLAAGLGVPVVGVIPLATKDVLTATNLNRMYSRLDHPLIGPAYNDLARAFLPGRDLAAWRADDAFAPGAMGWQPSPLAATAGAGAATAAVDGSAKRRGLFRR